MIKYVIYPIKIIPAHLSDMGHRTWSKFGRLQSLINHNWQHENTEPTWKEVLVLSGLIYLI